MKNILTASKVKERHEIIRGVSNSVFDEEERAFLFVTKLSWILPTIILCGGLVDLLLSFVYMKFYHPWKEILSGGKKTIFITFQLIFQQNSPTYVGPEGWVCGWVVPVDKVDVGKVHVVGEDGLHSVGCMLLPQGAGVAVLLGLWGRKHQGY